MKSVSCNLKKVYKYGKKYNKNLIVFIICSCLSIVINIFFPLFCAKELLYISNNLTQELLFTALIIMSIMIMNVINNSILKYNSQKYFRGVTKDIQIDLSKEICKIKCENFDKESSGVFIQRLTSDSEKLSNIFINGIQYITSIVSQVGIYITALFLNFWIGIYYLITSSIITLLYVIYSKKVNTSDNKYREQSEKTTSVITELIRGIRDIKMLNSKNNYINNISNNIEKTSDRQFELQDSIRQKNVVVWTLISIFEFILVCIIIYFIKNNFIAISTALIIFNYHSDIYDNLMEKVDQLILEIKDFSLSSERVFSILNNIKYKKEKFGKEKIDKCIGNFEFKNVSFSYDGSKQVLNNLNLKIKENNTYAIVGKSGEGKTTIFNLLCRLYDGYSGNIYIDGKNINELDEESIRGNITIISQNPYIFNMSIKENLKLVLNNVTDSEIEKACELACMTEFINKLPDKYDTVIGEGGFILSGGQKQRLAIARAFLQQTKIILFDEATSALDNETQSKIQEAINNMKNEFTIVIIAHRLSTIKNCSKIIFIKDGKNIYEGSHELLIKECEEYKKLYEYELIK